MHIYDTLKYLFNRIFVLIVFLALMISCAVPVAPTGGPPDTTAPVVERTVPESGTTNFDGDEVRFQFSEFVERSTARQNISIEPNLGIRYEVGFSRRTVIVSFIDPLPDNTTIIVKAGTDITDTRRNKMTSSYDLALSTGPVLDDGTVTARLRDAKKGSVDSGERVFLYRSETPLTEPANYVAQSDTAGNISFSYIREGTYRAFWVNDVNRDRRWNREREAAQPFSVEEFYVEQGEEVNLGTLYIDRADTVSPVVNGVGLLSERRLRLRMSEQVRINDQSALTVLDSLGEVFTTAYPLYIDQRDPQVLLAQAEEALPENQQFTIVPENIFDEAGNRLVSNIDPFSGSSEPDTTRLRLMSHNGDRGLFPEDPVRITYSKFIDDSSVIDSLVVIAGDREFTDWPNIEVNRNFLEVYPQENWEIGTSYQINAWNPEMDQVIRVNPRIWQRNQLGSIEFRVDEDTSYVENRLLLSDENRRIEIDTTFVGSIEISNLPPLSYTARVFRDLIENNRWDSGSVDPFIKPEPYVLRRNIPVREGFTSEVEIEFETSPAEENENNSRTTEEESEPINDSQESNKNEL